jgi:hypothetical protein
MEAPLSKCVKVVDDYYEDLRLRKLIKGYRILSKRKKDMGFVDVSFQPLYTVEKLNFNWNFSLGEDNALLPART